MGKLQFLIKQIIGTKTLATVLFSLTSILYCHHNAVATDTITQEKSTGIGESIIGPINESHIISHSAKETVTEKQTDDKSANINIQDIGQDIITGIANDAQKTETTNAALTEPIRPQLGESNQNNTTDQVQNAPLAEKIETGPTISVITTNKEQGQHLVGDNKQSLENMGDQTVQKLKSPVDTNNDESSLSGIKQGLNQFATNSTAKNVSISDIHPQKMMDSGTNKQEQKTESKKKCMSGCGFFGRSKSISQSKADKKKAELKAEYEAKIKEIDKRTLKDSELPSFSNLSKI